MSDYGRLQRILRRKGVQGLSSPCFEYFRRNKRHVFGGLLVMCVFALVIPSTLITTYKKFPEVIGRGESQQYDEFHKKVESGKGPGQETETPYGTCSVRKPKHPRQPMNPILVATFPGSSSDLMRLMIETMTGAWTSARDFRDDVVAIKTHYPYYDNHISLKHVVQSTKGKPAHGLLVMRDPMDTLQIFHSFVEMTSKSQKEIPWHKWRDAHFEDQLKHWDDFMRYWLNTNNLGPKNRHITVHERLTSETDGVEEAIEMVEYIRRVSDLPNGISMDDVPCLWNRVVTFQVQVEAPTQQKRRKLRQLQNVVEIVEDEEEVEVPFTYVQLDKIAGKLTQLIDEFVLEDKVLHALMDYRLKALEAMKKVLGDDPVLVSNTRGTCMVTTPIYEEMIPMYQASFPGSGSEMMRDLIEAVTGVKTGETTRRSDVVAIKTIYPDRKFDIHPSVLNRDMKKMVFLIRCPLHAISSKFNHYYWRQNDLKPHSIQPPKDVWEAWRDEHYEAELHGWVEHLEYWMTRFKPAHRLIVSYESLTDKETGPQDAMRLALFIRTIYNEGVINPAPSFTLPCLWFRAVRIFDQGNSDMFQDNTNHLGGRYHPPFTTLQLEMTAAELNNLMLKYQNERRLTPILQKYWEHTINMIK